MSFDQLFQPRFAVNPAWAVFDGQVLANMLASILKFNVSPGYPNVRVYWVPDSTQNDENSIVGPLEPPGLFSVSTPGKLVAYDGVTLAAQDAVTYQWMAAPPGCARNARTWIQGVVPATGAFQVNLRNVAGGPASIFWQAAAGGSSHLNIQCPSPFMTYTVTGAVVGSTWYAASDVAL